jgi:hypothetical protein
VNVLTSRGVDKIQCLGVQAKARCCVGRAVQHIADNRMTERGEVGANLVTHTGCDVDTKERMFGKVRFWGIGGVRFLSSPA